MTNEQYYDLITPYEDAQKLLLTKLEILNHNIYNRNPQQPVHHIEHRIKSKRSLEDKLRRRGYTESVQNAKDNLTDIAGIRVICYFESQIYDLAESLRSQNDIYIARTKDYIAVPKENGYRSYHLIVCVPLCCMDAREDYPVELQFRTLSMDLWASMEHHMNYKKNRIDKESVAAELLHYAGLLEDMEHRLYNLEKNHPQDSPGRVKDVK